MHKAPVGDYLNRNVFIILFRFPISFMMTSGADDLRERAEWDGAEGTSRRKLLASLQSKCTAVRDISGGIVYRKKPQLTHQTVLTVLSICFLEFISPAVMVPEHRLETLLKQANEQQIKNCFYHDSRNDAPYSLYSDHVCDK